MLCTVPRCRERVHVRFALGVLSTYALGPGVTVRCTGYFIYPTPTGRPIYVFTSNITTRYSISEKK